MTVSIRERLNLIGQELNAALAAWIDQANWLFTERIETSTPEPHRDLIRFANQDGRYNGHRFCREGVPEPDLNNQDTWFFHAGSWRETGDGDPDEGGELSVEDFAAQNNVDAATCNTDPFLDNEAQDFNELLNCVIAQGIANGNITNDNFGISTAPEWAAKTFHPRIAGFGQNTAELEDLLLYGLPGDDEGVLSNIDFRIMCVGDALTIGVGEDLNAQSYRSTLRELLKGERAGQQDVNTLGYVGSTVRTVAAA